MSERAEQLAERFQAVIAAFALEIEALSDAEWRTICPAEGWSVGVVARHIAIGSETITRHIHEFLADPSPKPDTVETIHQRNASDAARLADCTKAETVAHLRASGVAAVELVRGLTDAQLGRRGLLAAGFPERDVAWLAGFLVRHLDEHRASIHAALARERPDAGNLLTNS
jgi:hypothetical protein